ncbi:hypothetical protein Tco_1458959 [Tanacetum coccineum]
MERKAELNNGLGFRKAELNNVQRVNKQNQFVPSAVLTRTVRPVLTSTAMKVNTVKHIVNRVRPENLVLLGEKEKLLLSPQQVVIGDHKDTMVVPNSIVDNPKSWKYVTLSKDPLQTQAQNRPLAHDGNKDYLMNFKDFNGALLLFGGSRGYITGKGKIKTGKLDFEDVCFVKELQHFNLFSVSQICDKKNKVLFTDSECLVLSSEFKLPEKSVLLTHT